MTEDPGAGSEGTREVTRAGGFPELPVGAWLRAMGPLDARAIVLPVRFIRPLRLRQPLVAAVRGLFGARFRDLRCLTRAPRCEGCTRREDCDYANVLETPASRVAGAHGSHGIHPLWLRGIPAIDQVPEGLELSAEVVAVGFARDTIAYLDVALREAFQQLSPGATDTGASRVEPRVVAAGDVSASTWSLEAASPLALSGDLARCREECPAAPWFALLVRAGIRRVASLASGFVPGYQRAQVQVPDLRGVVAEGGFKLWRSARYSARQERAVPLEGWTGRATVRGEVLHELSSLLSVMDQVGVGKATARGMGHLRAWPVD